MEACNYHPNSHIGARSQIVISTAPFPEFVLYTATLFEAIGAITTR